MGDGGPPHLAQVLSKPLERSFEMLQVPCVRADKDRVSMACIRTAYPLATCVAAAALALLGAAPAMAADAPALASPTNAASFTEGAKLAFEWSGALQGDPDTLTRSFFRVEVATTANVPADAQATWDKLANYAVTTPGDSATKAELGVPEA